MATFTNLFAQMASWDFNKDQVLIYSKLVNAHLKLALQPGLMICMVQWSRSVTVSPFWIFRMKLIKKLIQNFQLNRCPLIVNQMTSCTSSPLKKGPHCEHCTNKNAMDPQPLAPILIPLHLSKLRSSITNYRMIPLQMSENNQAYFGMN